jgi:filamentous hemagglutinin family protein
MDNQSGLGRFRPKLIAVAVASCFVTSTALANPTGHSVAHGNVTVKEVGNLLKIHNSPNAVINWRSFSIGANEITRFIQESRNSVVMNRVIGSGGKIDTSIINGALKSNGRVYLLNSSGVVFGEGSVVDVAGLVVSSLQLSDADFHAKRLRFTDGAGAGRVENHGHITTQRGGEVYLVGPAVANSGVITSPNGDVVLAAGNQVELVNPGTPNLRVEITAPENQAVNLGSIVAESGRIGIYAGLINNSGTIRAGSAVAEGGRILLKAKQSVTLESSSILDASGVGGGTIEVLAKNGGTVNVAGRLDASAPTGGNGGFIETSATEVNVATGTVVTTRAPHGKTGLWLVDPNNYRIASYGGDITGAQLASNLSETHVALSSDDGEFSGSGDIIVDDAVLWNSNFSLTLLARRNVDVNQSITNGGSGDIRMYAGWNGNSSTPGVNNGTGSVNLNAAVRTGGDISLIAGNQISQNGSGALGADGLLAIAKDNGVFLSGATNDVRTIAGQARNNFYFNNGRTLTVGEVNGVSGISVDGDFSANVQLTVSGNQVGGTHLNVNKRISVDAAYGGQIYLSAGGAYGGDINVRNATLSANGSNPSSGSSVYLNGSTIRIENSTVEATGQYAGINVYANGPGGVNIENSSLLAQGRAGANGGTGSIYLQTGFQNGNVSVQSSDITAKGRVAYLSAYGGNVTVRASTMTAAADGGGGLVEIYADNRIDIGSSALRTTGENPKPAQRGIGLAVIDGGEGGNGIILEAQSDITLGSLSSDGPADVRSWSGRIVDGNNGANIVAPSAFLFGANGIGSISNPLETQVSSIELDAYGGQIGIANLGNLRLDRLTFGGSDAAIGTTGTFTFGDPLSSISVPGNLALLANNGMVVDRNISASGNLFLAGGSGDLGIFGVSVHGHNVNLQGNSILVGSTTGTAPTSVTADHVVTGTTALNFNVIGGANSSASSVVRGENVDLTVGGAVNISSGSAYAQIESTSPTTITLTFPNRSTGGFFVNGSEGAISDGNTGFFAAGQPAVLGQSLKVTYGGIPDVVQELNNLNTTSMDNAGEWLVYDILTLADMTKAEEKALPICQ